MLSGVKYNLKEQALLLLMEKGFDVEQFKLALKDLKPTDGTDWDSEKRKEFAAEIFRARKDLDVVAEKMEIPIKTCLAYYFGTYKTSDDYRLLKTVTCEERQARLEGTTNFFVLLICLQLELTMGRLF